MDAETRKDATGTSTASTTVTLTGHGANWLKSAAKFVEWFDNASRLRLHCGEMTAQEMRTARAVVRLIAASIRKESRP